MLTLQHKQRGVTLVELMIGTVVGLIVLAGITSIYVNTVKSSAETLKSVRLNQELRAVMDIMLGDLRRAGYWGNAASAIGQLATTPNPFQVENTAAAAGNTDLKVLNSNQCILYTYDADADGVVDAEEYFGFKLNAAGDAVMIRSSGSNTGNCDNGNWESLTDSTVINITSLSFATTGSTCTNISVNPTTDCYSVTPSSNDVLVEQRQVRITMTGQLTNDANIRKTIGETVKIRNDRVSIAP